MIKVGISGQGFKANGDSERAQPQVEITMNIIEDALKLVGYRLDSIKVWI